MKKKRWFLLDLASPLHNRPINEITSAELLYRYCQVVLLGVTALCQRYENS
jgi:hypothetical protein